MRKIIISIALLLLVAAGGTVMYLLLGNKDDNSSQGTATSEASGSKVGSEINITDVSISQESKGSSLIVSAAVKNLSKTKKTLVINFTIYQAGSLLAEKTALVSKLEANATRTISVSGVDFTGDIKDLSAKAKVIKSYAE